MRLTPRNEGSGAVTDATVRLRWSVPLAGKELSAGCLRADERTVLRATGTPAADAAGEAAAEQLHVPVRLPESAPEVTLDIDTGWPGSAVDANPSKRPADGAGAGHAGLVRLLSRRTGRGSRGGITGGGGPLAGYS
ncbi:hypothetical protein [Streptomyces sp. NPDC006309]|uniref:hypothetical protein n=1 Tax=Streptomyces sp. NPDC006309 TaxID=3156749 RepID=UPI0033B0179B